MAMTVQEIIDLIMKEIPGERRQDTVDTLKTGNPSQTVTGIVSTFTATIEVIRKTIEIGANLIITHEPTFYNHRDLTEHLAGDKLYKYKRALLDDNGIAVWRFHDYWHQYVPDGIVKGMIEEIGFEDYSFSKYGCRFNFKEMTLEELAKYFKNKLEVPGIRMVGNPSMKCRKAVLIVGAVGGEFQLECAADSDADVFIVGETVEWQVCEYFRDSNAAGMNKALIILGHACSEEAGMKYFVQWLKPKVGGIPVMFIPAGDPLGYV